MNINQIPSCLFYLIVSFLSPEDLEACPLVSKQWYNWVIAYLRKNNNESLTKIVEIYNKKKLNLPANIGNFNSLYELFQERKGIREQLGLKSPPIGRLIIGRNLPCFLSFPKGLLKTSSLHEFFLLIKECQFTKKDLALDDLISVLCSYKIDLLVKAIEKETMNFDLLLFPKKERMKVYEILFPKLREVFLKNEIDDSIWEKLIPHIFQFSPNDHSTLASFSLSGWFFSLLNKKKFSKEKFLFLKPFVKNEAYASKYIYTYFSKVKQKELWIKKEAFFLKKQAQKNYLEVIEKIIQEMQIENKDEFYSSLVENYLHLGVHAESKICLSKIKKIPF